MKVRNKPCQGGWKTEPCGYELFRGVHSRGKEQFATGTVRTCYSWRQVNKLVKAWLSAGAGHTVSVAPIMGPVA